MPKLLSASRGRRPTGRSPIWPRRRPTLLDGLTLTETSVCAKGANRHAEILFWKNGGAAAGVASPDGLREQIAKAELASLRANDRVDEVYAALAKRDVARSRELLHDPETYEAYRARLAGERWQAPVKVAKAEPDHRAEIRELLAAGDADGLTRLFRSAPAAHGQYRELLMAGELVAPPAHPVAARGA